MDKDKVESDRLNRLLVHELSGGGFLLRTLRELEEKIQRLEERVTFLKPYEEDYCLHKWTNGKANHKCYLNKGHIGDHICGLCDTKIDY